MKNQGLGSKSFLQFAILTYTLMLLSWGSMAVFQMTGISMLPNAPQPSNFEFLLNMLGGLSPSIAGIIMVWRTEGRMGLRKLWRRAVGLNLGWRWYLVILIPCLASLSLIGVRVLSGGLILNNQLLTQLLAFMGLSLGLFISGPLTEEFGWRGFALDHLLARWDYFRASLILGLLWAFWHLPLYFIPYTIQHRLGNPLFEFPVFALSLISQSVIITWIYLGTRRSLWSAILFHFAHNFSYTLLVTLTGGDKLYNLLFISVLYVVAVIISLNWNRRLSSEAVSI